MQPASAESVLLPPYEIRRYEAVGTDGGWGEGTDGLAFRSRRNLWREEEPGRYRSRF